jgi:hypothetical protein
MNTLPVQTVPPYTSSSNNGPNLTVLWTLNGGLTACYWSKYYEFLGQGI